jgi:hypothetical protein
VADDFQEKAESNNGQIPAKSAVKQPVNRNRSIENYYDTQEEVR